MAKGSRITEEEVGQIISLKEQGCTIKGIFRATGWSLPVIRKVLRRAGYKPAFNAFAHPKSNPTPEEIAQRSAEIREGWSEEDFEIRAVGEKRIPWLPPITSCPQVR